MLPFLRNLKYDGVVTYGTEGSANIQINYIFHLECFPPAWLSGKLLRNTCKSKSAYTFRGYSIALYNLSKFLGLTYIQRPWHSTTFDPQHYSLFSSVIIHARTNYVVSKVCDFGLPHQCKPYNFLAHVLFRRDHLLRYDPVVWVQCRHKYYRRLFSP